MKKKSSQEAVPGRRLQQYTQLPSSDEEPETSCSSQQDHDNDRQMPTRHCAKDLLRFRSKKVTIQPDYMGSIYRPQQSYQRRRLFLSTNHTPSKSGISKGNTQINSHGGKIS